MLLRLGFALVLLASGTAAASTRWVPLQISTIQGAIDASAYGDSVIVAAGIYREHVDFRGKAIYVGSEWGRDSTFIVPVQTELATVRFVTGENRGSVLDGFTIRGSRDGWGVLCSYSGPTIRNCDVSYTQELGRNGSGIECANSYALIQYNRIHHNAAKWMGGGIYVRGLCVLGPDSLTIAYNDIYNNWGRFGSGIHCYYADGVIIHHNLIRGNFGNHASAVSLLVYNTRFYNNTVIESRNGVDVDDGRGSDLRNNIVAQHVDLGVDPALATYNYNDVWDVAMGAEPGPAGLSADPLFVDPAAGDYSLHPASPCINAGDPDPSYNDPDGTRADMGAGLAPGYPHEPFWLCPITIPGDVNSSGAVTAADVIGLVNYVFKSGPAPQPCSAAGDANCDGSVTSADIIREVNYLFGNAGVASAEQLRKGGDPPCNSCALIQQGIWDCPE